LFTEPKDAAAKKNGDLSQTAKSHLISIYIAEYWGRKTELSNKEVLKGKLVEPESIKIISILDGEIYEKNTERKSNEWITGECDINALTMTIEAKSSWSAESFLPQLTTPLDKMLEYQGYGYMWLWDKPQHKVCHVLCNTPDILIQGELRKLLYSMDVISEESHEYKEAAAELMKNMIFDDIPIQERCISRIVERNEEIIEQIPQKVTKAREFLSYFHKKHTNLNKKTNT
jgi:hypothetical protein